ncbi:MAG: hypothetical protein RR203_02620 [Synergistaceae bacterium]
MNKKVSEYILLSNAWAQLSKSIDEGTCSQSISVVLPQVVQEEFVLLFARKLLLIEDVLNCPDYLSVGSFLITPTIEDSRLLRSELPLAPTVAKKRLAIIWEANKLSLEAMNSLLKITEEPPKDSYLLFISSEDNLLPTIKSRVWNFYIEIPSEAIPNTSYPQTDDDWCLWFEATSKSTPEEIFIEVSAWITFLLNDKNPIMALKLENALRFIQKKKLPVTMIKDIFYCLIKEDLPCEQIFGNIW